MVPCERVALEMFKRAACSRLKGELLKDGVKIAPPSGARELDMLASVDSRNDRPNLWVPIKVLAVGADELAGNLEHTKTPGLVIALVWRGSNPEDIRTFAFTPAELIVVKMIALIGRENAMCAQETTLQRAIEPFTMWPGQWRTKITTMLGRELRADAGRG
jgi:hypothetical protein